MLQPQLLDEVSLQPFDIPDGSAPAHVAYLLSGPFGRDFTLLVSFPDGWNRTVRGYYEAAEEVVVLSGQIDIGDISLGPGDWGFMPAGWVRTSMKITGDTVAVARFFGPARWVPADKSITDDQARSMTLSESPDNGDTPLGPGVPLQIWDKSSSWTIDSIRYGLTSALGIEVLDIAGKTWTWVPANEEVPAMGDRCFVRGYEQGDQ